jgi:hypothetical protein
MIEPSTPRRTVALALFVATIVGRSASADTISGLFGPVFQGVSSDVARSIVRSVPQPAASSPVTWRFDGAMNPERDINSTGQVYLERPETVGRKHFTLTAVTQRAAVDSFNGKDLGNLHDRFTIVRPRDGAPLLRFEQADMKVYSWQTLFAATVGVADRLEVNATLPIVTADASRRDTIALYRHPVAPYTTTEIARDTADDTGVGDLTLRVKYDLTPLTRVGSAVGLGLRIPTGDPDDLSGTGATEVLPIVIVAPAERRIRSWLAVRPYLNLGMLLDADDSSHSEGQWGVGVDGTIADRATLGLAILGRHLLGRNLPPGALDRLHCVARPAVCVGDPSGSPKQRLPVFGITGERPDYVNVGVSARVRLWRDDLLAIASVLVPLTDDGVRLDPVPFFGFEAVF